MPLFHWPSCEVLRYYRPGNIIVEAQFVAETRKIAEHDFVGYIRERYKYLYYDDKPMDHEALAEIADKFGQLYADLSAEPGIITNGAVFIEGSE